MLLAGAGTLALAACSAGPVGKLFGKDKDAVTADAREDAEADAKEDPKSKRVAVLALQQPLTPDPRFEGVEVSIPPSFANTDWSQPGGEPDHAMHHLSGPERYERAWISKIGPEGSTKVAYSAPPVIVEGRVYAVDPTATLRVFSADDGKKLWERELTPDIRDPGKKFWQIDTTRPAHIGFGGGVAVDQGRVFVASGFGFVAGIDAENGELRWQVDMPAPVRNPPTAANGKVFVMTTSNQVLALDQVSGKTVWTYESFEENARFLSAGSAAVDGDTVVVPFSSGEVVALSADNGRLLWQATVARSSSLNALSTLNDIAGSPVIDRGGVFAVSHSGQLSAIDGRTGQIAWEAGIASLNTPWLAGDYVFVLTVDGMLVTLARSDGAVVWTRQLDTFENMKRKKRSITWAGPILAGDQLILVSSAGELVQVSPQDGSTTATRRLKAGTTIPPVIADGTVYVVTTDGKIEAWR